MSLIEIDKRKVDEICKAVVMEINAASPFCHPIEVLFGLAEALGRIIATQEGTHVVHNEMLRVVTDHIKTTVKASYAASGKNAGAIQ